MQFQLTRSRGARPYRRCAGSQAWHFNSRAHVERDCHLWRFVRQHKISTHALTWSATTAERTQPKEARISTHALTWSATRRYDTYFPFAAISTHALTWSATLRPQHIREIIEFQLTRSRGARQLTDKLVAALPHFNSRAHVERDRPKKKV